LIQFEPSIRLDLLSCCCIIPAVVGNHQGYGSEFALVVTAAASVR
jgi:hypothetical protein